MEKGEKEIIKFKTLFFRHYDRKIADGSITFSRLGINKKDFTKLCTEEDFVFEEDEIRRVSLIMNLSDEETKELIEAGKRTADRQ